MQNEAEGGDPADRPGASGADQRRQACFAPSGDEQHPEPSQKGRAHMAATPPPRVASARNTRTLLPSVATRATPQMMPRSCNSQSQKAEVGQSAPDQDSRSDGADGHSRHPTAGATMGVRPPLLAPVLQAPQIAILSCNFSPSGYCDQGRPPRVCLRLQAGFTSPARFSAPTVIELGR